MGLIADARAPIRSADEIMKEILGDILEKADLYIKDRGVKSKPLNLLYDHADDTLSELDSLARTIAVPININCTNDRMYPAERTRIPVDSPSYYIAVSKIPVARLTGAIWVPYEFCIFSPGRRRYVKIDAEGMRSLWLTWHDDGVYPMIDYSVDRTCVEVLGVRDVYKIRESMKSFVYDWLEKAYGILEWPRK